MPSLDAGSASLVLLGLVSCGGPTAALEPSAAPTAALSPSPVAPVASAEPDPKAAANRFLEALQSGDAERIESTTTGKIGWEVIAKRFGTLQSFEVRDDALNVDHEIILTASTRFKNSDLVFALVLRKDPREIRVTNFKMIEVVRTRVVGVVASRVGRKLKVTLKGGWAPEVGAAGELVKVLDASLPLLGGGQMSLGSAKVVSVGKDQLELEITEEKSKLKVDGKSVDQLAPGEKIDFFWSLKVCTRTPSGTAGPPFECID